MSRLTEHPDVDGQFWQSYEECLLRTGAKSGQIYWHKNWCNQFLSFIAPRPQQDLAPPFA